jgi:hypothetical protein
MSPRSIRRAQERKAAKEARKAARAASEAQISVDRQSAQPGDSRHAEAYRLHIAAYENEYQPVGLRECELVQSLADLQWRLNRIRSLEMAIYAQGPLECESELEAYFKYEKHLRNLHIQEARLVRRYQQEMGELRKLQKVRRAQEEPKQQQAGQQQPAEEPTGFDFSTHPIAYEPTILLTGPRAPASGGFVPSIL